MHSLNIITLTFLRELGSKAGHHWKFMRKNLGQKNADLIIYHVKLELHNLEDNYGEKFENVDNKSV